MYQKQTAKKLGISQKHLNALINYRRHASPDLAMELAREFQTATELWFRSGGSREDRLRAWRSYDARKKAEAARAEIARLKKKLKAAA